MSVIRKTAWAIMLVLATGIAAYTAAVLILPGAGALFVAERRALMPASLYAHLAGSLIALALGPWQLNSPLRQRALGVHRWMGRGYVLAVVVGGLGAISLARVSEEGLVTHVGFGLLGALWLTATLLAYLRIRARDQVAHRRWMFRSYALTLAAVTLRIYLPVSQLIGVRFSDAYQVVAWLCWVPNLVIVEWWLLGRGARTV